jgi:hypothetical protein
MALAWREQQQMMAAAMAAETRVRFAVFIVFGVFLVRYR